MKEAKSSDFHEILKNFKVNVQEENIKILQEELNNQHSTKHLNTYHSQRKSKNLFMIARNNFLKKQEEKSFIRENSINKVHTTSTLSNEKITQDLFSRFDEFQRRHRKELEDFQKVQNHIRKVLTAPPLLFTDLKVIESDSKRNLFNSSCKKYLLAKNDDSNHSLNKNETRFNKRYSISNFTSQLEKTKNEFPIIFSYNHMNKTSKNLSKTKSKIKHIIKISPNNSNVILAQKQKIKTYIKEIDRIFIEEKAAIRKNYVHRIIL